MKVERIKAIVEAILFAAGRVVTQNELRVSLEVSQEEIQEIMAALIQDYKAENRGIQILKVAEGYQMCTKEEYHEYLYPILDKRSKPKLSNAALETLAIIAYNPKITRAEIESIRGVGSDGPIYKLREYQLIEEAGRLDLPGRPTTYQVTEEFLKLFGYASLEELPDLPRYKLDENEQIVIDDLVEEVSKDLILEKEEEEIEQVKDQNQEGE